MVCWRHEQLEPPRIGIAADLSRQRPAHGANLFRCAGLRPLPETSPHRNQARKLRHAPENPTRFGLRLRDSDTANAVRGAFVGQGKGSHKARTRYEGNFSRMPLK